MVHSQVLSIFDKLSLIEITAGSTYIATVDQTWAVTVLCTLPSSCLGALWAHSDTGHVKYSFIHSFIHLFIISFSSSSFFSILNFFFLLLHGASLAWSSRKVNTNIANMPADRTEANQWTGNVHNRFRHLFENLLPGNLGRHCRKWPVGKADLENELLIWENSEPRGSTGHANDSIIKDQSERGSTLLLPLSFIL